MNKLSKNDKGFSVLEVVLVVGVVLLIGTVGWLIYKSHLKTPTSNSAAVSSTKSGPSSTKTPSTSTNTTAAYTPLSPAKVDSKTAECNQTVVTGADGDPAPVTCGNGDLNVNEWKALVAIYPASVMTLGYNATQQQITAAVCNDNNSGKTTVPIEDSAYQIAALYFGWTYQSGLVVNANC